MESTDVSSMRVRAMTSDDWPAVLDIYQQGIATGDATFELDVPSWDRWETLRTGGNAGSSPSRTT